MRLLGPRANRPKRRKRPLANSSCHLRAGRNIYWDGDFRLGINRARPKRSFPVFLEVKMATTGQKKAAHDETRIVLQVGSELRIKNNGDIVIDNPELELLGDDRAADAVLF